MIVDAFSSGALLAPALRARGLGTVHVQSSNRLDASLTRSLVTDDFERCIDYASMGHAGTVDFLRRFPVVAVLPGCDPGVIAADRLAADLGVERNRAQTVLARRSKYAMNESLRARGQRAAVQIKSASLHEVLSWYDRQSFGKVVVKPEYAARSQGVSLCADRSALARAFETTIDTINLFGITNSELVVQEYLPGPEYMVNTMSVAGRHFVTDMWLGVDTDEEEISTDLYAELVRPGGECHDAVADYVRAVLDCTGVDTGPAHVEVRYTPAGPALVELGARLQGALSPRSVHRATGLDPIELTVDAYLAPSAALQALQAGGVGSHARFVYFHSDYGGTVTSRPDLSGMYALESVQEVLLAVREGDRLQPTADAVGRPGYAYLVHEDPRQLQRDYERFRVLEQQLYRAMLGVGSAR